MGQGKNIAMASGSCALGSPGHRGIKTQPPIPSPLPYVPSQIYKDTCPKGRGGGGDGELRASHGPNPLPPHPGSQVLAL